MAFDNQFLPVGSLRSEYLAETGNESLRAVGQLCFVKLEVNCLGVENKFYVFLLNDALLSRRYNFFLHCGPVFYNLLFCHLQEGRVEQK